MGINLLSVSAEQITMYINIGMLGLLALGLIGFLFGLIKGVWKKSFSLIYYIVCFVLLILFTKSISKGIYNYDVYSLANQIGFSFDGLNETNRTIGDFLHYQIVNALETNNIVVNDDLFLYVDGVVLSVIQFAIFLVGIFVIYILGIILCPLLYHLIFKWFIPKRVRKHTKLRLLGGLMGFVEYIVVFCLLLSPFSALINTVVLKLRDEDGNIIRNEESTDETYNLIMEVLEGYNSSILANALFTIQINGKSFDVALMDYITESNLNSEDKVHLYEEIGGIGAILVDALASGALNLSEATVDITKLIESSFVKNTFYTLAESSLITVALPIALSIALNNFDSGLDLSSIDLSDVDWADTTRCVGDIFDSIKNTGYIQSAIQDPNNFVNTIKLDRENEVYIKEALLRLGNSTLISTLMPQVIVSFLNSGKSNDDVSLKKYSNSDSFKIDATIFSDFPEDAFKVDTYKNINWGDELVDMFEIVLMITDQLKTVNSNELFISELSNIFSPETITSALLGINDNNDYSTEDIYKNNIYLNGGKVNDVNIYGTKAIFGCSNNKVRGLLDLQIIDKLFVEFGMMPKFISIILDFVGDEFIDDKDKVVDDLEKEVSNWKKDDWKNEFGSLLELLVPLMKTVSSLEEYDSALDGLTADETNVALSYFSKNIDDSYLMSELVPTIIQSYVNNPSNEMDIVFGLKLSDLNFIEFSEGKTFGSELNVIISEFLPSAKNIVSCLDEGVGLDTVVSNNEDLKESLKAIHKSEITNRKLSQKEIEEGKASNFEEIIINIFCIPTQEDLDNGFDTTANIPTLTENLMYFEKSSVLAVKDNWVKEDGSGELDSIFNFFKSIKDENSETNYIYDYFTGSDKIDIKKDVYSMGPEIERIFSTVDESILIKEAFPNTLHEILSETSFGESINFNNVENWDEEGQSFSKVLSNIDELRNDNKDKDIIEIIKESDKDIIKEYQFEKVDYKYFYDRYQGNYHEYFINESKVYALLNDINTTQSIDMQGLLYDALKGVLSPEGAISPMVDSEIYESAREDFYFNEQTVIYNKVNIENHYVSWNMNQNSADDLEYYGEIFNFSRLLGYSSSLEDVASLHTEVLDDLLKICIKSYPMRKLIGPIIDDTMNDIKGPNGSFVYNVISACDLDAFDRLIDPNCRQIEINDRLIEVEAIVEVYDQKNTMENLENDFDDTLYEMTKLDQEENESNLTRMLTKMHRSEMFNSSVYIASNDRDNNRDKLTSFEVIFKEMFKMNSSVFNELENEDLFELNNRDDNDLWIENSEDKGEIYNYNLALNKTIKSDIYVKVVADQPSDSYSALKKLYLGEKKNHVEELSNNFASSILLEKQLPNVYDNHIYSAIKQSVGGTPTDNNYKLAKKAYSEFIKYEPIIWNDEGITIDELVILMNENNIDLDDPGEFDSSTIEELFEIVEQSKVLHSSSTVYDLDKSLSPLVERSFNEYLVCTFETKIIDDIYDPHKNMFEIENPLISKKYTTTYDILDYELEEDVIIKFLEVDEALCDPKVYDEGEDPFYFMNDSDNFTFDSFNELSRNKLLAFAEIIDMLYVDLSVSNVFNFKDRGTGVDNIKDNDYLNRSTYEHSIIHLSNQIRTSLVESFSLDEAGSGYIINENTDELLDVVSLFYDEEKNLIDIVNNYAEIVDLLKGELNIAQVATDKEGIKRIIESIGESYILNHTSELMNSKSSDDLSIYDDIVLYLVNKINASLVDSLNLNNKTASVTNIRTNFYLQNDNHYQEELDLILDDGGTVDIVNTMDLENENAQFNITNLNNENSPFNKNNVKSLLENISSSRCMNYSSSEFDLGRNTTSFDEVSTFEDTLIEIFAQDTFVDKVYDENNEYQNKYLADDNKNGRDVIKHKVKEINSKTSEDTYIAGVNFFEINGTLGEVDKLFNVFTDINGNQEVSFDTVDDGQDVLKSIAKIYILHDMVPKQIHDIAENEDISKEGSSINKVSDFEIINTPEFYVFEYNQEIELKYPSFEECAVQYDEEIDDIISLVDYARAANVSGDIKVQDSTTNLFEDLLTSMDKSLIYRCIGPDAVTMIFNQMSISLGGFEINLCYFINNSDATDEQGLIAKATAVQANFNEKVEHTYEKEGIAFDEFFDYAIAKANLSTESFTPSISLDLMGYIMVNKFNTRYGF